MTTFLMLSSLALGLLSWVLALISMRKRRFGPLNLFSGGACSLSLLLQLVEIRVLSHDTQPDFSAITDSIHAVVVAGAVLVVVALVLNYIAMALAGRDRREDHS